MKVNLTDRGDGPKVIDALGPWRKKMCSGVPWAIGR